DVLVHRIGKRVAAVVAAVVAALACEDDNLLRIAHREQAQDQLVDESEDCGVGADAQGQRDHCDTGEDRRAAETAKGELEILEQTAHACLYCPGVEWLRAQAERSAARKTGSVIFAPVTRIAIELPGGEACSASSAAVAAAPAGSATMCSSRSSHRIAASNCASLT